MKEEPRMQADEYRQSKQTNLSYFVILISTFVMLPFFV